MNNKSKGLWLALGMTASLAVAKDRTPDRERTRGEFRDKMAAELKLTKEQKKKLETHRIDQRAEMEKLMLVVKEKRDELKTALEDANLNKIRIQKINDELKDAQNALSDQRLEGILYVRDVLTPEQFKKFLSFGPEHEGWREGRMRDRQDFRTSERRPKGDRPDGPPEMDDDRMEEPERPH